MLRPRSPTRHDAVGHEYSIPNAAFRACRAAERVDFTETERFESFTYDELVARDKANLDITWLRDESLEDNLRAPEIIARGDHRGPHRRPGRVRGCRALEAASGGDRTD